MLLSNHISVGLVEMAIDIHFVGNGDDTDLRVSLEMGDETTLMTVTTETRQQYTVGPSVHRKWVGLVRRSCSSPPGEVAHDLVEILL